MEITFLAKSDLSTPSTNYRCHYLVKKLNELNICTHVIFPLNLKHPNWWINLICRFIVFLHRTTKLTMTLFTDVLFVQGIPKRTETAYLIRAYKKLTGNTVVQNYDDANYLEQPKITELLTRSADKVLVPSQVLVEYAQKYNNDVHRFPLGVDTDIFTPPKDTKNISEPLTFVWVGHTEYQFDKMKFLSRFFQQIDNSLQYRLKIVGPHYRKLEEEFRDIEQFVSVTGWAEHDEVVNHLQNSDIGLCYIPDDEWNNAKFPVKIMEMLACGLPVIGSVNSEARNIISNGEDGFLVENNTDKWRQKIEYCLSTQEQIDGMKKQALETVQNEYSMKLIAGQLKDHVAPFVE